MPTVKWPYTEKGEDLAKKAAERFGGTFVSDKKSKPKPKGKGKGKGGIGVMIAVGPVKKYKKKSPARRTSKKA